MSPTQFSSMCLQEALSTVEECGVFLSEEFPYLATSPDDVISIDNKTFGVSALLSTTKTLLKWPAGIVFSV